MIHGTAAPSATLAGVVRPSDVLIAADANTTKGMHVAFSALDECEIDGKTFRYGISIPVEKATAPEVLLAHSMNGVPLEPEHGFPLRLVTPVYAGVRSLKWLAAIEVRDCPSENPIQAKDYKMLPPDVEKPKDIDWTRGATINEMPLNSLICEPVDCATLHEGRQHLRGYAIATDRRIARVEVSVDGGCTWQQAELEREAQPWSWAFWSFEMNLLKGEYELVVRAWDDAGETQLKHAEDAWNLKGYLSAAWHRVNVTVR